jgi:hypothetical protein
VLPAAWPDWVGHPPIWAQITKTGRILENKTSVLLEEILNTKQEVNNNSM